MDTSLHTAPDEGATLAEIAAQRVHDDILSGRLRPGARLGVAELAARHGIGATPIREGLSRLVARGLIVAIGRRGFRVADTSPADLADLTRFRLLIEREGMRLALRHGDDAWEAGIVGALHALRRAVERQGASFGEGSLELDAHHKAFHAALIAACGSPRIIESAANLYDQAYRYRRLMMRELTQPEVFVASHEALARAALARDADTLEALLREHLESTLRLVYPEAVAVEATR